MHRALICLGVLVASLIAQDQGDPKSWPYTNHQADSADVALFQEGFQAALDVVENDPDSSIALLEGLRVREQLAAIYRGDLLAQVYAQKKEYARADSILEDILEWAKPASWRGYLSRQRVKYRARVVPPEKDEAFYRQQLSEPHDDSVEITILLNLMGIEGFTGKAGPGDDYLPRLLSLDLLDKRIRETYDSIAAHSAIGDREASTELALARYESHIGRPDSAIKRCFLIPSKTKARSILKSMRLFHPGVHYQKGDYAKAITYYKKYLKLYGNHSRVLLQLARSYKKMGKMKTSTYWYDVFSRVYPSHRKTEEIYWARAWDREHEGNVKAALEWYGKLLPKFRGQTKGRWANFRMGFTLYKDGNYDSALTFFELGTQDAQGGRSIPACWYWLGKTREKLGGKEQAWEAYHTAAEEYPLDFYGHEARRKIADGKPWNKPDLDSFVFNRVLDSEMEKWFRDNFARYKPLDGSVSSGYVDIVTLLSWRQENYAILTFDANYKQLKSNPWFLYVYAKLFEEEWPTKAYILARRVSWQIAQDKWKEVPEDLMKRIYPAYFLEYIRPHASRNNLSEYFILALIKQESGFMPRVASWAGALGLMQIMPATGKALAKQAGIGNFSPAMLRDPDFNVKLGTLYLRDLMKDYEDNYVLVLCNYNAGPGPTRRWWKANGHLPLEEFAEEIGYSETRDYVKKVMGNYWTYELLYPQDGPLR